MNLTVQQKVDAFFIQYRTVSYAKREMILRAGDTISNIYYLKKGYARQFLTTEDGEDITLNIFRPPSYFPMMIALSNKKEPNKYFFQALTPITASIAPSNQVIAFLQREPEVLFDLATRFADGINGLLIKIENDTYTKAYNKVISLLLYLAQKFGTEQNGMIHITLPLTHDELATWVGTQRETLSRQVEKLERKNLITYDKNTIIIKSLPALEKERATES